ncbi:T-box transcription factor TBX22 [Labeo rohita]|uniref:T-box transcription factor TBX22 n=2 Tax=Labeo rohita TaxID=84645 RepID=A0ABQ8M366_LABRO|nr:T-box transcription factor TBX22 [Labeo rohita]KAI2657340.1 T-box transcription factor TBX22 [Labeo rohita]
MQPTHALSADASGKSCKKMKVENMKNEKLQCVSEYDRDAPTTTSIDTQDQRKDKRKKSVKSRRPASRECEAAREVRVDLQGSDLWKSFHEIGTEMIITKAGRRMFPSVRVKVHNLDPVQQYSIAMDIMPVDSMRYRYVYHSSQWMVAGNTDHSCVPPHLYVHPDSPCSGETWMRQVISFDRVKLTNNEMDDKGHIILKSMHKYRPRIHVILHSPLERLSQTLVSLPADDVYTTSFPETQFTTVTAYQNQQITKLKIDRNPFAKGFRERNGGVLDGMLESYSWHSPFNLDFKSFATELQGRCYGPPASFGITSSVPSFLPSSFSPAALPITFTSPQCCNILPSNSFLTYRAYCSICLSKLSSCTALRPVLDLPFMTALQVKKGDSCRSRWLQDSTTRSTSEHPVHSISAGWDSGDYQAQKDNREPAFVSSYNYSFPLSHHFPLSMFTKCP